MSDISVGAVGAAIVAGLVSLFGLIISKEQKISEFRQAWIDELRKCVIIYITSINAIADALRLKKAGSPPDNAALMSSYKALNEANLGISLRVNAKEKPAKAVLKAMSQFENLAKSNADLTPEKLSAVEKDFLKAARALLKFEWARVKRGEKAFVLMKWFIAGVTIIMVVILIYGWTKQRSGIISGSKDAVIELL